MEEDETLLNVNFVSCGYLLEQFVCSLGRILQWEPILKSFKQQTKLDLRQGFAMLFAQHLLGALDFSSDPFNHEFLHVPMGEAPSAVMKGFFEQYRPDKIIWFQAVSGGEKEVTTTSLSSHHFGK